jgi:hypothetical protein
MYAHQLAALHLGLGDATDNVTQAATDTATSFLTPIVQAAGRALGNEIAPPPKVTAPPSTTLILGMPWYIVVAGAGAALYFITRKKGA